MHVFVLGSPKSHPRLCFPHFCFYFCFKSARRWYYIPYHSLPLRPHSFGHCLLTARQFMRGVQLPQGSWYSLHRRAVWLLCRRRNQYIQEIDTYPKSPKCRQAPHRLPGVLSLSHPVSQWNIAKWELGVPSQTMPGPNVLPGGALEFALSFLASSRGARQRNSAMACCGVSAF